MTDTVCAKAMPSVQQAGAGAPNGPEVEVGYDGYGLVLSVYSHVLSV